MDSNSTFGAADMNHGTGTEQGRNGAVALLETLVECGVNTCFANPGTSEMHFVVALDRISAMRPILALFEGGVTGMADGYARIAGKPAATLLHLGSGLGNGIANLHNARRAQSPIVNIVGDHASYHRRWETPHKSDIEGMARTVSGWVRTSTSSLSVGRDVARAVSEARRAPGQVATLILPADAAWGPAGDRVRPEGDVTLPLPSSGAVDRAAKILTSGGKCVVLARGAPLRGDGPALLGRIAAATGASIMCDNLTPAVERGAGRFVVERVPYRAEDIVECFKDVAHLILVGTHAPVAPFAYPTYPSWCLPDALNVVYLAHPEEDGMAGLAMLADAIGANSPGQHADLLKPGRPTGQLDQFSIGALLARMMPEDAIVSDEAASNR